MDNFYYTNERNVQIVIALLKAHGIRQIIASPGTTNITFVMSLYHDPFFKIYSAPDERSAAYIACGLAAESGEAVVLTCTGATASRNYIPGLTEAYYRKLPVLAVTATQHVGRVGNAMAQVIDRSRQLNDTVRTSVLASSIHCEEDEWSCTIAVNKAILDLFRHGGGPAHINLVTTYSRDFSVQELPPVRVIRRYTYLDKLPELPKKRIAVFVGAHRPWTQTQTEALDKFCEVHNAVVICDWTSNYYGKYRCDFSLITCQTYFYHDELLPEITIHIGEISGAYEMYGVNRHTEVWRVNPDGEIRDAFRHLSNVFEMEEEAFFCKYAENSEKTNCSYAADCQKVHAELLKQFKEISDLPFSNLWMANQLAFRLPENSVLHLGILNSLRSWNLVGKTNKKIQGFSNTGGFGIDGSLSTFLGGSLAQSDKLHFCIIGDLAFFYDINVLGNRHIQHNMRILLINNGNGTEFRNYNHPGSIFGKDTGAYVSAEGHYGRKSPDLIKHYAEDLGFHYLQASDKASFLTGVEQFLSSEPHDKPVLFEVFTNSEDESNALYAVQHLIKEDVSLARKIARKVLPDGVRQTISKAIRSIQ